MTAETIRVLLVDDEPLLRRSLAIAIDHEPGLHVVGQAQYGVEAVADIVLMDIRMPELDGIDATRRILTGPGSSATRVTC